MFTILNDTGKKFNLVRGKLKEGRENRHSVISYGKMKIEAYIKDEYIDALEAMFSDNVNTATNLWVNNTRLYFNNKHYKPIIVGDSKTHGADFLFFVQKVTETERLVSVDHKSSAFVLESQRVKGEFIAGIVSFSISKPSRVTFITVDGNVYKYTTYSSDGKGNIERTVVKKSVSTVKDLTVNARTGIKPYRPFRQTHLVFVSEKDYIEAELFLMGKNYQLVKFKNTESLHKAIEEYKSNGFTAATLFVSSTQHDNISALEKSHLLLLADNFRVTHLTHCTGYTSVHSKAPVRKHKEPRENHKHVKNEPTARLKNPRRKK